MLFEIATTAVFDKWLNGLKDRPSKNKVLARLARIENGNFGDFRQLNDDLFELRFFFGPGLRIYYTIRAGRVVLLLTGGDKASQEKDIEKARRMIKELE